MKHPLDPRARRAVLAVGALTCAATGAGAGLASAAAPSATVLSVSPAASTDAPTVTARVADRTLRWGQRITVTGRVHGASETVTLQFRAPGGAWTPLAGTRTAHERYRFHARLPGRGAVRVVSATGQVASAVAAAASASTEPSAPSGLVASKVRGVRVNTGLSLRTRRLDVAPGRSAIVGGHALPAKAGRLVVLQHRSGRHWVAVDHDRTTAHGAYRVHWRTRTGGRVRVVARGDAVTSSTARSAGRVSVLRSALASWYGDYGGPLACGGTLGYDQLGVANKSLPCGTEVTIRYRGRTVRVPVIDRGPYVGGREFDLSGATARALRFDGVGTVQVSAR